MDHFALTPEIALQAGLRCTIATTEADVVDSLDNLFRDEESRHNLAPKPGPGLATIRIGIDSAGRSRYVALSSGRTRLWR